MNTKKKKKRFCWWQKNFQFFHLLFFIDILSQNAQGFLDETYTLSNEAAITTLGYSNSNNNGGGGGGGTGGHDNWIGPYFDEITPKNVTALAGKSAYLSCRVRNLGNKTVSKKKIFYCYC